MKTIMFLVMLTSMVNAQTLHSNKDPNHWYPSNCCSLKDCEPIPIDGLVEETNGWQVHYMSKKHGLIDEFVNRRKARKSQDGGFHGCWRKNPKPPRNICFFEPVNS